MSAAKKLTLRSLAEELEKVKEEVVELRPLKQKVVELEEQLKKINSDKGIDTSEHVQRTNLECKKCKASIGSRKELKRHIKEHHITHIQCALCDDTFTINSDLEAHMMTQHPETKNHNCDKCGKTFVLKWRLEKHMSIHLSPDVQACHYFNNNKKCPFEDLGCMFAHNVSGKCKFGKLCKNKLCSFQHIQETSSDFHCQEFGQSSVSQIID